MPTLAELQNPYASLNDNVDVEDELSKHAYVARTQNPYATIEVFGEVELPPAGYISNGEDSEQQLELSCVPRNFSLSKAEFQSRVRAILLLYEPLRGSRRILRPEFQTFIKTNENKSGQSRAGILEELQRFDISSMGAVNPHLNREGQSLCRKLEKISAKFS